MKIMFICTGNICRSAMAHKLLEKKLEQNNRSDVEVFSCGTFANPKEKSTYSALEVMKEYEVDLSSHQATNIFKSPIQDMDLILCATTSHKYFVLQQYPDLEGKVFTMKEYVHFDESGKDIDISDPWGYDIEIYRFCAGEIDTCLDKLLEMI